MFNFDFRCVKLARHSVSTFWLDVSNILSATLKLTIRLICNKNTFSKTFSTENTRLARHWAHHSAL